MPAEQDLVKLYSQRILALAASIPRTDRLEHPDASVRKRSPLCGSTVMVDLNVKDGRVIDYGQDVKACALGQAAASVLGAHIVGLKLAEIKSVRDALSSMLTADGPVPAPPFSDLEVLLPARAYKNRHASIMLALDASIAAFEQAEEQAVA